MLNFLILNCLLALFLLVTIFEVRIPLTHVFLSKTTMLLFFILLSIGIFFSLPFLLSAQPVMSKYLTFTLVLLISGHFIFLALNQNTWKQILFFVITIIILLYHGLHVSMLSQDLSLLFAFVWLGPFLVKREVLTVKRSLAILGLWVFYNMIFLLFHSTTNHVFQSTQDLHMPFSVTVGNSYLGIVDLVIPSLLISMIRAAKLQFSTAFLFVLANLLIGILAFQFNMFIVFPISLLWILLSIPLLFLDKKLSNGLKV